MKTKTITNNFKIIKSSENSPYVYDNRRHEEIFYIVYDMNLDDTSWSRSLNTHYFPLKKYTLDYQAYPLTRNNTEFKTFRDAFQTLIYIKKALKADLISDVESYDLTFKDYEDVTTLETVEDDFPEYII